PLNMRARASSLKRTSLAAMLLALDHGHDVFFAHDEEILAVDLDFSAAVFAERNLVADLDVERTDGAVFENLALADRDDLALDGLVGRGIGNHDATRGGTLLLPALHDDAAMKRTNLHGKRSCETVFDDCFDVRRDKSVSTLPDWLLIIGSAIRISRLDTVRFHIMQARTSEWATDPRIAAATSLRMTG